MFAYPYAYAKPDDTVRAEGVILDAVTPCPRSESVTKPAVPLLNVPAIVVIGKLGVTLLAVTETDAWTDTGISVLSPTYL